MKVTLLPTALHARRARRGADVVIRCRRNGVVDMYPKPKQRPSNSGEQLHVRTAWRAGVAAWQALSPEQKRAWSETARQADRMLNRQSTESLTGYRLFQGAARYRQLLELPILTEPAGFVLPGEIRKVEVLPSSDPATYRFRIFHNVKGPSAFRVIVSISPDTGSRGRKADRRSGRLIKGYGPASTAELPASGGVIEFRDARFAVGPGRRFGAWVRIIHPETGSGGPEFFADLTRPEIPPSEDAGPVEAQHVNPPAEGAAGQVHDVLMMGEQNDLGADQTGQQAESGGRARVVEMYEEVVADEGQGLLGGAIVFNKRQAQRQVELIAGSVAHALNEDSPAVGPHTDDGRTVAGIEIGFKPRERPAGQIAEMGAGLQQDGVPVAVAQALDAARQHLRCSIPLQIIANQNIHPG